MMVGLGLLEDKIREYRLRLFGHVYRRSVHLVVRRSDMIMVEGSTGEVDQS